MKQNDAFFAALYGVIKSEVQKHVKTLKNDYFCGFAYVNIDGREPFARWLKKQGDRLCFQGYPRGVDMSMYPLIDGTPHAHTQSMYVKEEAARVVVRVLAEYGIVGRAHSRPD